MPCADRYSSQQSLPYFQSIETRQGSSAGAGLRPDVASKADEAFLPPAILHIANAVRLSVRALAVLSQQRNTAAAFYMCVIPKIINKFRLSDRLFVCLANPAQAKSRQAIAVPLQRSWALSGLLLLSGVRWSLSQGHANDSRQKGLFVFFQI